MFVVIGSNYDPDYPKPVTLYEMYLSDRTEALKNMQFLHRVRAFDVVTVSPTNTYVSDVRSGVFRGARR